MNSKRVLEMSTLLDEVESTTSKFNWQILDINLDDSRKDEYCEYLHVMADKIDKEWRKKND